LIVDYHLHTKASPDGSGDFADFIGEAQKRAIDEIGFSEHLLDRPARLTDFMESYVENLMRIRKSSAIPMKLGAEVDFFPDEVETIGEFLKKYPFDYVIGSVHFVEGWPVDSFKNMKLYFREDIMHVYEEYFEVIRRLCKSRLFDVLGHADIVRIFGIRPKADRTGILEATAQAISDNDLCVEINTAGLFRPCAEIYPSKQFLKMLEKRGVSVTLGSDAHRPEHVGRSFDKALSLMKEVGYDSICTFEKRKRENVRI